MFKRFVERRADEALSDTPVVLIFVSVTPAMTITNHDGTEA